jgi:hypothetical protein
LSSAISIRLKGATSIAEKYFTTVAISQRSGRHGGESTAATVGRIDRTKWIWHRIYR